MSYFAVFNVQFFEKVLWQISVKIVSGLGKLTISLSDPHSLISGTDIKIQWYL